MTKNKLDKEDMIRVRVENGLKPKLQRVASKNRKKLPDFIREKLWEIANTGTAKDAE